MKTGLLSLLAGLVFVAAAAGQTKKLLLLAQGPDGHPPQTHEYVLGQEILRKLLAKAPGVETTLVKADEPWSAGPDLLAKADGAVLFLSEGGKWLHRDPRRLQAFRDLAARKGALVGIHWGMGCRDQEHVAGTVALLGGCHGGPQRKYKVLATTAHVLDPKHPIAAGLPASFKVRDEFYYKMNFTKAKGLAAILQCAIDGGRETVAWAWQRPDGGRSFGFSGLHFHENWRLPEYQRLVAQGVSWTLGTASR